MIADALQLTSTITLPEVFWTAIGLVGLTVSWMNLLETARDVDALERSGANGLLRLVALGNSREELLRAFKSVTICAAGVAAMLAPPANPAHPVSALSLIVTVMVFLLGAEVTVGSFLAARQRASVRNYHSPAR